jgi:hypothetical protein
MFPHPSHTCHSRPPPSLYGYAVEHTNVAATATADCAYATAKATDAVPELPYGTKAAPL